MVESYTVIFRSVLAFLTLFLFARILGKQQVTQLTFFEYVTGITIGSIAAEMSIDLTSRGLPHFVGLSVWFFLTLVSQFVTLRSRWAAKLLSGEPTVLIQNGHILDTNMKIIRYRLDELLEQLRAQQIFDISTVENAMLETNGQLSVQLKSQEQPVTPADLGIETEYFGLPTELIMDGRIIGGNLRQVGLTRDWLLDQLKRRGIDHPEDVFLAILNTQGELYVDVYQDRLSHVTDVSDYRGVQ